MLLAGDIGGTKTNLAVFADANLQTPVAETTLTSARYESLEELVGDFLSHADVSFSHACFGVAGPVTEGRATITNLPWIIDERALAREWNLLETNVRLINDLEAIAYAVPHLASSELHTLNVGDPEQGGTIGVIAPGTGLGEAFLTWDGTRYRAYPSEGGHTDFAPNTVQQLELLRYLMDHFMHVSYERVCSGIGIPNIYDFLKDTGYGEEEPALAEQIDAALDPTPLIANAALHTDPPSPRCVATLELFVSILGAEAGNLALKVMATGGMYIGGGIPPRILPILTGEHFRTAFLHKGRFSAFMERIPVHIILQPKAALLGAAHAGFIQMT